MSDSEKLQLAEGMTLGRYQLSKRLGAGGMGEVFAARHLDLGKAVAIKTLHGAVAARPDVRARFLREGQAAARIRHPNAVDVTDVGIAEGVPYLVMEMLNGEDLQSLLRRERMLPLDRIAALMLPTLSALGAAHEEGIVHRDLKPANIFLHRARDGAMVPKVLDFGISKMSSEDAPALTGTSALLGTPAYMSPEQLLSTRDVDVRSDIYSMGVILYECATGARPFEGDTPFLIMHAVNLGAFTPPRNRRPELPAAFEAIILRAMSMHPSQRFATAQELAQALLPFADPSISELWGSRVSLAPSQPPAPLATPRLQTKPLATPLPTPTAPTVPLSSPSLTHSLSTLTGNTRALTPTPAAPSSRRWIAVAAGVLLAGALGAGLMAALGTSSREPARAAAPPRVSTPPRRPIVQAAVIAPSAPARTTAPRAPAPTPRPAAPAPAINARPAVAVATPAPSPVVPATTPAPEPRRRHRSRRHRDTDPRSEIVGLPMVVGAPSHPVGTNSMPVVR